MAKAFQNPEICMFCDVAPCVCIKTKKSKTTKKEKKQDASQDA